MKAEGRIMSEVTLLKAKIDSKIPKRILIFECVLCSPFILAALFLGIWIGLVFCIFPIIAYFVYRNSKDVRLIITNKRVIASGGRFGSETNIPVDSISAVSKGFPKAVRVTSSSGIIAFSYLENPTAVYNAISKLTNARNHSADDVFSNQTFMDVESRNGENFELNEGEDINDAQLSITSDTIELLRSYKNLLDEGVLTQKEFEAKKKQLLDL